MALQQDHEGAELHSAFIHLASTHFVSVFFFLRVDVAENKSFRGGLSSALVGDRSARGQFRLLQETMKDQLMLEQEGENVSARSGAKMASLVRRLKWAGQVRLLLIYATIVASILIITFLLYAGFTWGESVEGPNVE